MLILLFLVQPFSSWAAQLADCAAESPFPAAAHGEMSHGQHGMSDVDNAAAGMDCCDDCDEACAGGGLTVSPAAGCAAAEASNTHSALPESRIHASPGPESLYRPPILAA